MAARAALELLIQLRDEASSGLSSLGGALGNVGMIAGGAALAGVVALGAAVIGGVGDAQEARALYASTEQTITTMGNAAGRSAQQVVELASGLSDAAGESLFGDDQIQQASNLLLTFGEIKGETFDLATALTVDLAQALGGAPADQAMMLGKALNDPVKGMSALGKAGLTFSEEQKAVIAAMQESGDMAGAQAIIIEELNKQVGGQAAAAAKAAGGMVQFKASMGETFETIGGKLLPILDRFGAWLNSPEVKANIELLATALADGIGAAVAWLSDVAIPALMQAWEDMEPTVMSTIAFIEKDVLPVLAWLADVVIAGAILQLKAMGWVWQNVLLPAIQVAIAFFVANVLPVLQTLFLALRDDLPRGIALAVAGWESMKIAVASFKETYIDPIINGFNFVTSAISNALLSINDFVAGVANAIIPSWLQGHSPPPLAEWFDSIGESASIGERAIGRFMESLEGGKLTGMSGLFSAGKEAGGMTDLISDLLNIKRAGGIVNQESVLEQLRVNLGGGGNVGGDTLDRIAAMAFDQEANAGGAGGQLAETIHLLLLAQHEGNTEMVDQIKASLNASVGNSTMPGIAPQTGAGGAGGGNVYVTVQGNVTSERDLILAIRDGLARLGSQNVTIFGAT